jgi:hypothetical protein
MLAFAQCTPRDIEKDFDFQLTDSQASNKDFMMAIVLRHPNYLSLQKGLEGDWDLVLLALADPRFDVDQFFSHVWFGGWYDDDDELCKAMELLRDELDLHRMFVKLVLCSLFPKRGTREDRSSVAVLSNQDGIYIMRHVAEYAGVPMGRLLSLLRKARQTLAIHGYHWKDF